MMARKPYQPAFLTSVMVCAAPSTGSGQALRVVPRRRTAFIQPGSPWENEYIESFDARFRGELPYGEIFDTLGGAQVHIESLRRHYDAGPPHSSLGLPSAGPEADEPGFLRNPRPNIGGKSVSSALAHHRRKKLPWLVILL